MEIARDEEQLDWMGSDCWFCGQRPPAAGKSREVKLKKYGEGPGASVSVLRTTVSVPRCAECWQAHRAATSRAVSLTFGGAALAFLVVVVWSPIELPGWAKAALVFGGLLPGATQLGGTLGLAPGVKPESEAVGFKAVEAMKQGGWLEDDQP
ncbi:MAG: hypothetical protein AB7N76_19920 [Planctomycetota bacterium]